MPSRSGKGRGSPSDRENRTSERCSAGRDSSRAAGGAEGAPCTSSTASKTMPCGCTTLPRRSAAPADSATPVVIPAAAATASLTGPMGRAIPPAAPRSLIPLVGGLLALAAVLVADAEDVLRAAVVADQAVLVAVDLAAARRGRPGIVRALAGLVLLAFDGGLEA